MSVEIMSLVFKRYPTGGGERLLALALADHAHDDGTRVFPSVALLAAKSVQSTRTVQRQLRNMEQSGWLIRVSDNSGGRSYTTEYRISPDWLKGDKMSPFTNGKKGDTQNNKGDIAVSQKGDIAVSPEPSITISESSEESAPAADGLKKQDRLGIIWDADQKLFSNIGHEQWRRWEEAFPKLEIDAEIVRIELWYHNNPKKRKRNIQRFITAWMARAFKEMQERARPKVFVRRPTA